MSPESRAPRRPRLLHSLLLTLLLPLLPGCGATWGACGRGSCLANKHVVSLSGHVNPLGDERLCPGGRGRLVLLARLDNGMTLSPGHGSWSVNWAGVDVHVTGPLSFDARKHEISLPAEPWRFTGEPLGVRFVVRDRPDLPPVDVPILVRYDCTYGVNLRGASGAPGEPGRDGPAGVTGEQGTPVPGYSALGGPGRPGVGGGAGGPGGHGRSGARVEVVVSPAPAPRHVERRLKVLVRDLDTGQSRPFLVDSPGSLTVFVSGGEGGPGGRGGTGGEGGAGGQGLPSGHGGAGAAGGPGGPGGDGGDGGAVLVRFPPEIASWLPTLLRFEQRGGEAGRGGPGGANGSAGWSGQTGWPVRDKGAGAAGQAGRQGAPGALLERGEAPVPDPW